MEEQKRVRTKKTVLLTGPKFFASSAPSSLLPGGTQQVEIASAPTRPRSAPDMHSLAMACVGLVPRPIPEPGLENAGVVGRARVRISGTMPRRRARTGNSYSPLCAALPCYTGYGQGWNQRDDLRSLFLSLMLDLLRGWKETNARSLDR